MRLKKDSGGISRVSMHRVFFYIQASLHYTLNTQYDFKVATEETKWLVSLFCCLFSSLFFSLSPLFHPPIRRMHLMDPPRQPFSASGLILDLHQCVCHSGYNSNPLCTHTLRTYDSLKSISLCLFFMFTECDFQHIS